MGRFPKLATRLSIAGAVALVAGSMMLVGVAVQMISAPAYAATAPFELFCTNSPIGDLAFNDVVLTGSLSPASPSAGQQFSLTGFQAQVTVPPDIVSEATAVGNTSITGTVSADVTATGATPSSIPTGSLAYDQAIPSPVPASGLALDIPSTPSTIGPFTATSSNVAVSLGSALTLTFTDVAIPEGLPPLTCSAYPNDVMPSGLASGVPPGLPFSPVIADAGQAPPPPPTDAVTGPYELYCPHTPVGDLVFNGVTTTASISPSTLSAGDQFTVSGYQTQIPLPAGVVSAAAGLGNGGFEGEAASAVDAYGASPDQLSTGSMNFDVPIPDPVPSSGIGLDIPTTPMTVGPFTADGGPVTIAADQSTFVVAALSSKAFTMSCTAYPNDTEATSGSTGTAPDASPIRPIIAVGTASGTAATTTTTIPNTGPGTLPQGSPYELYCPGSPVGNLVLNDTVTTGTISPSTLTAGDQFDLADLQTQFSIPQAVAEQAEKLGVTELSGDMSVFLNATGVYGYDDGYPGGSISVVSSTSSGATVVSSLDTATTAPPVTTTTSTAVATPITVPPNPEPYPEYGYGDLDMSFDVTLPDPVPSTGVQFVATPPQGENEYFTADGGPIQMGIGGVNLNATEFGDSFGLFCSTFPNDTQPTGLSTAFPEVAPVEPVIATGQATIPPPQPEGQGPYELYCPGTPVGDIAFNNVTTTATLSPANPAPGTQFNVTGYQTTVDIPASIASAAAAIGNTDLSGTASTTIDASGATPASIAGSASFDVPIPSPVPASGVQLTLPSSPMTIGPFTASGGGIVITQDASATLSLEISGSALKLDCESYPNNSDQTGITIAPPFVAPTTPVIALGDGATGPPPPPGEAGAYELYCPGTPVGNIVLNNVTTSGTLSPSDPSSGEQFNVTGYQTQVALPTQIVTAAAALGNSAIVGTAAAQVDATGATPASVSAGTLTINAPIPSPVPPTGLVLDLPSTPETVGPFTATGGAVTITEDPVASLTLVVSGSDLSLTCRAYTNNSEFSGIVDTPPPGDPVSPVIATSQTTPPPTTPAPGGSSPTTTPVPGGSSPTTTPVSGGSSPTTTPLEPTGSSSTTTPVSPTSSSPTTTSASSTSTPGTTAPVYSATNGTSPSTTAAPATTSTSGSGDPSATTDPSGVTPATTPVVAASGALAFTGPGAQLRWLLVAGTALVVLGLAMLIMVDAPRRAARALAARGGGRSRGHGAAARSSDLWVR